ncbi:hypothetical protein ACQPW1_39360 [Nocardia sp. CA-128927]|uniref:hypothetical protein n=1 Tax=Nocardia sp. CA-128927 TaxID=3239975 RepID=UPI003D965501
MARAIEPTADATRAHATGIANAGFDSAHTGQDYQEQGRKLATGVDGIVAMLHSWSQASGATAAALQQAVTANISTDEQRRAQTEAAARELGNA